MNIKKMTKKDKAFFKRKLISDIITNHVVSFITLKKDLLISEFIDDCLDELIDELEEKDLLSYQYEIGRKQ